MRRFLFAAFTFVFSMTFASPLQAATVRLIELHCRTPQESGGDELRLDISPDTGSRVSLKESIKKGQTWGLNRTISFHKSTQIQLTELDTVASDGINFRDENLGKIGISAVVSPPGRDGFPGIQYAEFKGNGAYYVLSYQVLANAGRDCELVSLRCVVTQEKDADGDELRLHFRGDGGKETTLSKNGVKAGSVWNIGRKINFFTNVTVRLVENDGFGIHFRDENLGTKILNTPSIGLSTVEFTGHGARYILTYRMTVR